MTPLRWPLLCCSLGSVLLSCGTSSPESTSSSSSSSSGGPSAYGLTINAKVRNQGTDPPFPDVAFAIRDTESLERVQWYRATPAGQEDVATVAASFPMLLQAGHSYVVVATITPDSACRKEQSSFSGHVYPIGPVSADVILETSDADSPSPDACQIFYTRTSLPPGAYGFAVGDESGPTKFPEAGAAVSVSASGRLYVENAHATCAYDCNGIGLTESCDVPNELSVQGDQTFHFYIHNAAFTGTIDPAKKSISYSVAIEGTNCVCTAMATGVTAPATEAMCLRP
jgi:hypothetical protein